VRTFRTTTSRRVDVFPRLVASEHVVDALFIRDGNVRFRPVFVSNGVRVRARFAEQLKRVVFVVVAAVVFFSLVSILLLLLLDGEQVPAGWTKREHLLVRVYVYISLFSQTRTRRHTRALSTAAASVAPLFGIAVSFFFYSDALLGKT